jgi:putative PIN family toxin of toxin-antitoxin system
MKIVLDTNCLVPIVIPHSYCWDVWQAFIRGDYTLCVSNEILMEYREILEQQLHSAEFAEMVLDVITNSENVEYVNPAFRFNMIEADPDDNKFVDCAITANATYIVSNDTHFDVLEKIDFPSVDVMTLREFKRLLTTLL